jgi:hypothetical protein
VENLYQGLVIFSISGDIIEALDEEEKKFFYDKWRIHYFKFKLMVYFGENIVTHVTAYINDSLLKIRM